MVIKSWVAGFVLCLLSSAAMAQDITGSIAGTVKDSTGAVISGAKVTITSADTAVVGRTTQTDESGAYLAPRLAVGRYNIVIEKAGFRKATISGIQLNVHDELTENAVLQVGATTQEVTVQASAVQVELESPQAAGLIDGTQVREIPLNSRNYEQLVNLQPGVTYGGGDQLYFGTTNPTGETNAVSFSINGQRNSANNWTVDGADNVDRGSNLTLLAYPSVDAIAEFKTLRGNYSAEFGRSASGQIDVVTKSGTNHFHGDLYEFFRNDVLNASPFFSNLNGIPRPTLRYNDFGYSIGGPVAIPGTSRAKESKTFFFFSNEFYRIRTQGLFTGTVPTAAERTGQFPHQVCVAHNATGGCSAPLSNTVTTIDPLAAAYLKDVFNKLPLPNNPTMGANSLITQQGSTFDHTQELVKIDHTFGPRLNVFFRFINDSIPTVEPGGLFTNSPLQGVSTTTTNSPGRGYLGHFTSSLSPTFLLDGGYGYSSGAIISDPTGTILKSNSPDIAATLPFSTTLVRIPSLTFTGGSSLTSANVTGFGQYRDYNRDHNVFANVTKIIGRHAARAGFSYHHYQKTENASGNNAATFGFDNAGQPAVPVATSYEQAFANFLTGFVSQFTQASVDLTPDVQANQIEFYGQDEWRIRSNLTLSYGLRLSHFGQPADAKNSLTNFDPEKFDPAKAPTIDTKGNICTTGAPCAGGVTPNPNFDPLNGIIINGQNSPFGKQVASADAVNVAPRFGFAWDPLGHGKTSIRGGYGVAYDSTLFGIYEQNIFTNLPFVQSISIPNTQFDNPGAGTAAVSFAPRNLRGSPVHFKTPYNQQWSLDVQHEVVRNLVVDVGYYGSKGTHLLGIADINEPQPGAYVAAGLAPSLGNNPRANEAVLNQIRPFKGYGPINQLDTRFDSNYHSFQAGARWQLKGNSMIGVSYTWSHALTDAQTDRSSAAQNTYDPASEYGPAQLDRRHVFTANYVYDLPFFRSRHDVLGYTVGGWEIAGLVTANTGLPITVTSASPSDPAGQGVKLSTSAAGLRPDQIGNPNSGAPHTLTQWFNVGAFADVPAGQFRPGNERPGAVIGPGFQRWDVALMKNIPVHEDMHFQFRAETFNVFNHTNFDTVNRSLGGAGFGQIASTRAPRIMQLALKFYF